MTASALQSTGTCAAYALVATSLQPDPVRSGVLFNGTGSWTQVGHCVITAAHQATGERDSNECVRRFLQHTSLTQLGFIGGTGVAWAEATGGGLWHQLGRTDFAVSFYGTGTECLSLCLHSQARSSIPHAQCLALRCASAISGELDPAELRRSNIQRGNRRRYVCLYLTTCCTVPLVLTTGTGIKLDKAANWTQAGPMMALVASGTGTEY